MSLVLISIIVVLLLVVIVSFGLIAVITGISIAQFLLLAI